MIVNFIVTIVVVVVRRVANHWRCQLCINDINRYTAILIIGIKVNIGLEQSVIICCTEMNGLFDKR